MFRKLPYMNDSTVFGDVKFEQNSLQLLLFVDDRRSSQKNVEQIKTYLHSLTKEYEFYLEVIEIGKHPHLVEYFKLVATPALVKINPPPKHTLAGSDLIEQLQKWWHRWQNALFEQEGDIIQSSDTQSSILQTCIPSSELIRLSDEIFRLKQEKEELKQQLEFKDQMLAMLAHDLRSPLTAASMAVETIDIVKKHQNPETAAKLQTQLCQQAKKQFKIMDKMINDLLQMSHSMNRELKISPVELKLTHLCDEILLNLQSKFQEKNLTLVKDIPQDLPVIYGDPELMRQVFVNLLENAIKYTPKNGQITCSIIHRTSWQIQASISDTGMGIPKEKRELIFQGHFRLKRDENTEGYGIGLALCRKVINAHNGQIWVDSNIPKGSCFHFTLPVY
jgi:two-component system clock-associated histidine kinase SasA